MKTSLFRKWLLAMALTSAASHVVAEDIDIYAGNNSNAKSNVILVLSNEASWSASSTMAGCVIGTEVSATFGDGRVGGVEICGLYKAITAIGSTPSLNGKLNMGVMLYEPGSGGTFKFPAPPSNVLPTMDTAGIATLQGVLRNLTRTGDNVNSGNVGGSMQESWAFYNGKIGMSGRQYVPLAADVCGKNFVIHIGIAKSGTNPGDANAGNTQTKLSEAIDAFTPALSTAEKNALLGKIFLPPDGSNSYARTSGAQYWADEWARFNYKKHGIITYTITLKSDTDNPEYIAYMKSMAEKSGGEAFVVEQGDVQGLVQALLRVFNSIQAVNSVFAAASLPISVNAQGTFLNQIYFGMFRPDPAGLPRWAGNLKQYQFAVDKSGTVPKLYMADTRINPTTGLPESAINSGGTGFFDPNAISFWTSKDTTTLPDSVGAAGGFFINNPQGGSVGNEGFDLPDGEIVEKGGVAQRIRLENLINNYALAAGTASTSGTPGNPRRLYTCTSGAGSTPDCGASSLLSATPFANSNNDITDALLGTGSPPTNISTLTRVESTATVVTATAMNPVLVNGQKVTITGTSYSQYNGLVTIGTPITSTTFTFPVTVNPPSTATGSGYVAATPGFIAPVAATSIVRSGSNAIVTISGGHTFAAGNTVTISGAGTGFDKSATVLASPAPTATTFAYALTISPGSQAAAAGTAKKGAGTTSNIASITIGTPNSTSPFAANVVVELRSNVPSSGAASATTNWQVGNPITIAGTTGGAYDGTHAITSLGTGNSGACQGSLSGRRFCISVNTTPNTATTIPAPQISTPGSSATITGITRGLSCSPSATPANVQTATATATTLLTHTFVAGNSVNIGGGDAASTAYTGTVTVLASPAPTATTFSYTVNTDLPCADATAGKQVAVGSGTPKATLINWVRGEDNAGDEAAPAATGINVRPSIHGDVLHSRPAVVNYGGSIGVVVYYGSNDGTFRAINGNQTASITYGSPAITVPPGGELWGFIPIEFYGTLLRQYLNSPVVKLNSTATTILPTPQPKDYYFDGGIGVYQNINSSGVITQTIIYPTARRGGRIMYALDVTVPSAPVFLWKKTQADLPELGQTWSTPKVALVKGYVDGSSNPKPVVIFGAGYDPAEDSEPPAARTMGRGIYVLDAITGATVWQATKGAVAAGTSTCTGTACANGLDMPYPIAADITLVDRITSDGNGFVDRLYAADLGGNIWRVDLEPSVGGNLPSNWKVTKFASVGGLSTDTTRRKLFFPPDVVQTKDYDAILFATGDREHPTRTHQAVSILNRFYMLKDTIGPDGNTTPIVDNTTSAACVPASTATAKTAPGGSNGCTEAVPTNIHNASVVLPTAQANDPFTPGTPYPSASPGYGFYLNLLNAIPKPGPTAGSTVYGPDVQGGEKSVNAPTTIGGNTFFGSNSPIPPDPSICQPNLGTARGYTVNFVTGVSQFVIFDGGGLPPSPVSGLVTIDGVTYPFVIGAGNPDPDCTGPDCKSSVGGQRPPIPIAPVRTRTYWYRDIGNR